MPLLNSNQLVSAWRERLPTSAEEYDQQMINLGERKPGVYLVEAVNDNLRAYSIAVVTDLTMVQKTTRDGQVLVYVVDRKIRRAARERQRRDSQRQGQPDHRHDRQERSIQD